MYNVSFDIKVYFCIMYLLTYSMFIILLFVLFRYVQIIDIDIKNIDTDIDTDYRYIKNNKKQKMQYIGQLFYHIKVLPDELDACSLIMNNITQKNSISSLHNLINRFSS